MTVERLGIVEAIQTRAAFFAGRHPAHARRIYGRPRADFVPNFNPAAVVPIVKNPPKPDQAVEMSPELSAEIAFLVCKRVDEVLAQLRREGTLAAMPTDPSSRPSVRQIMEIVAIHADIRPADLVSERRAHVIAWPRQVAMTLVKETHAALSMPQIGKAFGGKDHTTVMHALKRMRWHLEQDQRTAQIYRRSRATIETKWPEAFK